MPTVTKTNRLTLTVREAASAAGVGLNTMHEAIRNGAIPSLRLGRRIVVPRAAFEKTLNGADTDTGKK